MSTILDTIVTDTRALVSARKQQVELTALQDRPFYHGPPLPFAEALGTTPMGIIAEIKKASPSKGVLRKDFDVPALAQGYQTHGAAAISVLTEPHHFHGSLDYLAQARAKVATPLLRKDFIIDAYQLHEARAYGADAVLLIAAILDRHELADLHAEANALGLACLVEIYDPAELDKLDFDQIKILGVNNRDLRTFTVNIQHSVDVFRQVPQHVIRVSESGLRDAQDLAYLRTQGIDAVLIGETFMRALDPGLALAQLLAETQRHLDDLSAITT